MGQIATAVLSNATSAWSLPEKRSLDSAVTCIGEVGAELGTMGGRVGGR